MKVKDMVKALNKFDPERDVYVVNAQWSDVITGDVVVKAIRVDGWTERRLSKGERAEEVSERAVLITFKDYEERK